jgi:guanylate kinase
MAYKIIALIGKAGSGKDTILKEILKQEPIKYNEIISCTTRPKRENEIDGVNYYFLTPSEFANKILNYEMLEATSFNDWFYGTSYDSLRSGIPNIGVFNPDGIRALSQNNDIDLTVYYIQASDKTRLLRQLNRENNPNVAEIVRRYKTDEEDFDDLEFETINLTNESPEDILDIVSKILGQN